MAAVAPLIILGLLLLTLTVTSTKFGDQKLVHKWKAVDLDWPSQHDKTESLTNGSFVPGRNLLAGIKIYNNRIFLTIPRWRWTSGQPATLLQFVIVNDQVKLRPYPNWASQKIGDCSALQYVQSMEIDPNTGIMYVIDTGRIGIAGQGAPLNLCPAKIVLYNLNTNTKLNSYDLPDSVVSRTGNFINDIVLDYVKGIVRYAYITDVALGKIYAFDFQTSKSWSFTDASMKAEAKGTNIHINSKDYVFKANVDGIAMSFDFKYVYYCPLGGYTLYQIPTSTLRNPNHQGSTGIRKVGRKVSQSDGMIYGKEKLYYGALGLSSVYSWDIKQDMTNENVDFKHVTMKHQRKITGNNKTMQWPDTFAFDNHGWLWFVSNRLHLFNANALNFSGSEINMRIWKVYVGDVPYLHEAPIRTAQIII